MRKNENGNGNESRNENLILEVHESDEYWREKAFGSWY
jgi:hypothetical protein